MSLPGRIALPGGIIRSPKWLSSNLVSALKPNVVDIWIGESLVFDTSNNVDNWPSMLHNYILLNSHATNRFIANRINGRQALFSPTATGKSLKINTISSVLTFITLVTTPTLPFADYESVIVSGPSQVITGQSGSSSLFINQSTNRLVDTVSTDIVSSGIHMIEASAPSSVTTFCVGGIDGFFSGYPTRDWLANIGCVIVLSARPSASQRTATKRIFNQYYRSSSF
jgi:hypothetical protein